MNLYYRLCIALTAVTMKDDILTAVADFGAPPAPQSVVPIAPLPSRLSFCLSPQRQQQLDAMLASNTSSQTSQDLQKTTQSPKKIEKTIEPEPDEVDEVIVSPTKKLLNCANGIESSCSISVVAVKRSPTVSNCKKCSLDNYRVTFYVFAHRWHLQSYLGLWLKRSQTRLSRLRSMQALPSMSRLPNANFGCL